jgi:hypothetical protein
MIAVKVAVVCGQYLYDSCFAWLPLLHLLLLSEQDVQLAVQILSVEVCCESIITGSQKAFHVCQDTVSRKRHDEIQLTNTHYEHEFAMLKPVTICMYISQAADGTVWFVHHVISP